MTDTMPGRRVEYLPLDELVPNPVNPKRHDVQGIDGSLDRFGVIDLIVRDDRTGQLISGHGRTETLSVKRDRGESPPDGVTLDPDGRWLVPVVVGWASRSDADASAALVTLNHLTTRGGWDDQGLLDLLGELRETDAELLAVTRFDEADLDALQDALGGLDQPPAGRQYSPAVDVPHYAPTRPEPPPVPSLMDRTRTAELEDAIRAAGDELPADVREYLLAAAQRHTVFRYDHAAEFYAHAPAGVQELMEDSALVIIDFDDAIRLGYVQLSSRLEDLMAEDEEGADA